MEEEPSLAKAFAQSFRVGAAVNGETVVTHETLLVRHFNSITAENAMKFASLQPLPDHYRFEEADALVDVAEEHGMAVRGHTLIWHNQTPEWVFRDQSGRLKSRREVLTTLKDHINRVVSRYRGRVYCWDVVNEAVSDGGDDLLRKSLWLETIGEDYLIEAFLAAHDADPQAQLFYNDYNECDPQKRAKICRLIRRLKSEGVPIHGMGLQAHWHLNSPGIDDIERSLNDYAELGVRLQITELDISVYNHREDPPYRQMTPSLLLQQAERYRAAFRLFKRYAEVIDSVTFWGIADDRTWLDNFPVRGRKDWPLLFDTDHRPKPAFYAIMEQA
ncbi:MAG: endo-1,4-beta-xylanase [Firmicutes bacterium]|nr:endo-1,4-beta-xylanase [Bacillota bacterium]